MLIFIKNIKINKIFIKFKTLFKTVSGLAICSSLVPFSVVYSNTHTHTQDSLNVGNSNPSNGITWNITDDGAISPADKSQISGEIKIPNSIKVSSGKNIWITAIKDSAFSDCNSLVSVAFDHNTKLEKIGDSAFENCKKLTTINLPSTLRLIDKNAFNGCSSLNSIALKQGLEIIRDTAFVGCSSLKTIIIPKTVSYMGTGVFVECDNLKDVYLNWDYGEVNEIYKWSHRIYSEGSKIGVWVALFGNVSSESSEVIINKKTETNIYLPNNASIGLVNLYKQTFNSLEFDLTKIPFYEGIGLDPKLTHFIGGQSQTNIALILAATFGSISLIWLGGLTVYFNRKIKKLKSTKKSK